MRSQLYRWLVTTGLAGATLVAIPTVASAQPDVRDHRITTITPIARVPARLRPLRTKNARQSVPASHGSPVAGTGAPANGSG